MDLTKVCNNLADAIKHDRNRFASGLLIVRVARPQALFMSEATRLR